MSNQIVHVFYKNTLYDSRIEYILDFLKSHPLCPEGISFRKNGKLEEGEVVVYYGMQNPDSGFFIPAQGIAFADEVPEFSELKPTCFRQGENLVYSINYDQLRGEPLFCKDRRFGFDIFETIFLHLTRMEEHHCVPEQLDTWDMMKSSEQFLSRYKLQEQPVVDHLVYCFFEVLGFKRKKQKTEYRMSHDIDVIEKFSTPYQLLRSSGKLLLEGKGLAAQKKLISTYWKVKGRKEKDPFDTFDWLLNTYSWPQKVIYFMTGGITKYDNHYSIEDQRIKDIIALAKSNGYSIGLHPSYAAWKNPDLFLKEKKRLEEVVGEEIKHSRQHFLHFSFADTPELLEANGIKSDSTLGYQDLIGFRCGTGFPYRLYNFKEERAFDFLEIPLVVMDSALLGAENNVEKFERDLKRFLSKNEYLTNITFNFHNSIFDPGRLDSRSLIRIYKSLEDIEGFLQGFTF